MIQRPRPTIFTLSAFRDEEAELWIGTCDAVPAAAEAPTLDLLLLRVAEMTSDLLAENHPDLDPASVFLQLSVIQEIDAQPAAA